MTASLSRDALLRRLHDAPPAHLRTLYALGDAGVVGLLNDIPDALSHLLSNEPKHFDFNAFLARSHLFLRSRENYSHATPEHQDLLTALVWWLICEERSEREEVTAWEGGTYMGSHEVHGDLVVAGDLVLHNAALFVTGDVHVHGSLADLGASRLVTGGGARVTRSIAWRSQMFAVGRVEAPLISFGFQDDGLLLMDGACAAVFFEERCPGWSAGEPEAPVARTDQLVFGEAPVEHVRDLDARIRATLNPELVEPYALTDGPLDYDMDWFWDEIWPILFTSGRPLDQLLTQGALEVFRNRSSVTQRTT